MTTRHDPAQIVQTAKTKVELTPTATECKTTHTSRLPPTPVKPPLHNIKNRLTEVETRAIIDDDHGGNDPATVPLAVRYKRNLLYNFIYGELRTACLPRLLGFLTWKDILALEGVTRWCNVAALSKSTGIMKRVPSAAYLSYFMQTSPTHTIPRHLSPAEYENLVLSACGMDKPISAAPGKEFTDGKVHCVTTFASIQDDLCNYTIRELHMQERVYTQSCTHERRAAPLTPDVALHRLGLSNDAFEHAWCVNFAIRWPDLVEIASIARLCVAQRTPVHASFFDSPAARSSGLHAGRCCRSSEATQIVVPSPKPGSGYMHDVASRKKSTEASDDSVVFDAVAEEDTDPRNFHQIPHEAHDVDLGEDSLLSSRSRNLRARHTTWYVSTLASWRSLFRALHEAEADHERTLRMPRSYLPEGNHFIYSSVKPLRVPSNVDGKNLNATGKSEPFLMSPSAYQASERFHAEAFKELQALTSYVKDRPPCDNPVLDSAGEGEERCLSHLPTAIPFTPLSNIKAWPRPQSRTILMKEVDELEARLNRASIGLQEVETKTIMQSSPPGLDGDPDNDAHDANIHSTTSRVLEVARRRAMGSSLSPIHLLDALLANLAKLNKSGTIPPAPIQGAIVSLTIKLVTCWMRAEDHNVFELASFAAVRAGVCQAHMIMSLPSYAKFALREWLIQQTRVRLARDLPLTCAPPALLLAGHTRVQQAKAQAVGSVFAVSPISANLLTPSSDMTPQALQFIPERTRKPPAALAVLPLCICQTLGFVVNRLAADFAFIAPNDRHTDQIKKWKLFKPPACDCEALYDFLKRNDLSNTAHERSSSDAVYKSLLTLNVGRDTTMRRRTSATYTFDQMQRLMSRGDECHEASSYDSRPSERCSPALDRTQTSSVAGCSAPTTMTRWRRPLPDGLTVLPFPLDGLHTLSVNL